MQYSRKKTRMKKRILSVLISGVLLFGTVFANAVSIDENSNPEATTRITEILATEMIPHIHTGNSTSGGGCYTVPVYHVHNNTCYKKCPGGTNQWLYDSGPDDHLHWNDYGFCNVCGGYIFRNSEDISWVSCNAKILVCGKSTSTVESWKLNCTNEDCFYLTLKKNIDSNGYVISPEISNLNENTEIKSIIWNTGDIDDCNVKNNGNYILTITYSESGVERTYQKELDIKDAYVDYTVNHYQMNLDGTSYTLIESETNNTLIGDTVNPETKTYIGFTSPEVQEKQITAGTNTINYYYTRNKYPVTYIDQTSDGKELEKNTIQVLYDSEVKGSDIGSSVNDNTYHNQYRYIYDTSATVTIEGATVYRIFEFCFTEKESHITWNDNNNEDGLRPEKYTLKLKQNGIVVDEKEFSPDITDYVFENLSKYDEDGNSYQYELETVVSDRYKIGVEENGNLIFEYYQPANFSVIIPKSITLDGNTGNADYIVSVNGTFYYNDTLTVIPESSFILTDRNNISSMKADVSQTKIDFTKEDGVASGTTANGNIQVNRRYFSGLWNGSFNFDIRFKMQN